VQVGLSQILVQKNSSALLVTYLML